MDKSIKNSAPNNAYGINNAKDSKRQPTSSTTPPSEKVARKQTANVKPFRDTAEDETDG